MSLSTERMVDIAEEALAQTENERVRREGPAFIKRFRESDPEQKLRFCKIVMDEIDHWGGKSRKEARKILNLTKARIAEEAIEAALRAERNRQSASVMYRETLAVFDLIERQGRGVVYFGSARTKPGDEYYELARELGREVSLLLGSTSWSGAGPGQMEAPMHGAKEVGGRIGGIKIQLKPTDTNFEQEVSDIFAEDEVVVCRYFGPRKIGLVDAGVRQSPNDRTAFIVTPGGFGTLDEMYEKITLEQTKKFGSKYHVPTILMNYDGFFDQLLNYHQHLESARMIKPEDIDRFTVCRTNEEAVSFLADFYNVEKKSTASPNGDILPLRRTGND